MSNSEDMKTLRRIIDRAVNHNELSMVDDYVADHVIEHEYLAPRGGSGADNLRGALADSQKMIKDLSVVIQDMVEANGKIWMLWSATGIERKTGKAFSMMGVDIYRFESGKIAEHWGLPDRFAMMHQVGLISI